MTDLTIQKALQAAQMFLSEIENNHFEAELLLCHVLGVSRSYLYAHHHEMITARDQSAFQILLERRKQGEPIAYLLGSKEFWSLEFSVDQNTLIPRPETETLVQAVLDCLPMDKACVVADLGVGSGAVVIALAKERPLWQLYGTDISSAALAVAKKNSHKLGVTNINFLVSDWCEGLPSLKFDVIASNPPYIAQHDPHLNELTHEPTIALVSGDDGLDAINIIIETAANFLKPGGWLLIEHGYDQAEKVQTIFDKAGYVDVRSIHDMNAILRVTQARKI